jgi:hypothetical protein
VKCLYEHKEEARAPCTNTGTKTPAPVVLFGLLANEARTKGECIAHVAKRHMINPWHRLRPLPAAPLVVRRRYLIEVPSPLTVAPLVVRCTMLWPLRRCALRVLYRGAPADARPAVRAHDSTVKKDVIRKVSGAHQHPAAIAGNVKALG